MQSLTLFFENHPNLLDGLKAAGFLTGALVLNLLIPRIEALLIRVLVGRTETRLDDDILDVAVKDGRRLVWMVALTAAIRQLSFLPDPVIRYGAGFFYVLGMLFVAHLVSDVLLLLWDWYNHKMHERIQGTLQSEFSPLVRKLIYILIYLLAVINILHHFNQSVNSIIVSLGVGSLAVALAAKDTLANMISGFMIMTDRPFRIGDRIRLESGETGDVYDIGLRSTRILTFDNTLIVVPNQQIINEKVTNLSYPDPQIRVALEVGVAYGSDLDRVKQILVDACKAHPSVLEAPEPAAYFVNFGDSSLDFKVVCRVATWGEQWGVGEELRLAINRAFEKEKIEIPFPQRDIHIKSSVE